MRVAAVDLGTNTACAAQVRELLPDLELSGAIGVAGTITTAASILAGGGRAVDRDRVSSEAVEALVEHLADRYGLDEIEVSERDLLDGAALAAADQPAPEEGAVPPTAFTCC